MERVLLLAVVTCAAIAQAAELDKLTVARERGIYTTEASFIVAAPVARVRELLLDYEQLGDLNPYVKESRIIERDDGRVRVLTRIEDCVVFFCLEMELLQDVTNEDDGRVSAVIVPNDDFDAGHAVWQFESEGAGTRVIYHSELEPGFFIPPLIGSLLVKNRLQTQIRTTAERLETLATEKQ